MSWTASDIPDQSGRTVVVTGATSGLGLETTRRLARRGARVLLAARNPSKTETVIADLRREDADARLEPLGLDLADLSSVRAAAAELAERVERVDVLVNNAGIMFPPRTETADGFELQIGVNHLGHFAFTGLVLPLLLGAPTPRVVTVSSGAHRAGRIRRDDLMWTQEYSRFGAYGQSKLANLLFTAELDRRARQAGTPLVATAAHPGWTATALQSAGASDGSAFARISRAVGAVGNRLVAMPPERGALPQLYAATADGVTGNSYWGPQGLMEMRGRPGPASRTAEAEDLDTAAWLWTESETLTGVRYAFTATAGTA